MQKNNFILINACLAAVWLCFVYVNLTIFFKNPKFSVLLFVLAQSEFVVLLLIRKPAVLITKKWADYFAGIGGTFIALLFQPALMQTADQFNYIGDALIYLGVIFEIIAFLYLNTSAGIVPANRGVKMRGPYALVRHPIYASYLLLYVGYALSNPTMFNLTVLILAIGLQVWRISREEAILKHDPAYKEYLARVKWRLVPFVF